MLTISITDVLIVICNAVNWVQVSFCCERSPCCRPYCEHNSMWMEVLHFR